MSATQKKGSTRGRMTASRGSAGTGRGSASRPSVKRPAAKRTQAKRGSLAGLSAGMPKRGGASRARGRGIGRSKPKQGNLEQLMGKVAGAASSGAKSSKRGPAIMALVGAGGAGLAALGKKRKAQGQADEPAPGPQVHMGTAENAEPVVVKPEDITEPKAGA